MLRLNKALAVSMAEQQVAESRFRDVAEAASDWFFEQDERLQFTFVSSRFEDVTGLPAERLIGKTRWDDAAAHGFDIDTPKWREHIADLKAHRDWRDFSYVMTTEAGDQRTVTTSGKAIFDIDGRFQGYRGVGRDISRRIALEEALQQAQKMELVGQLTGGIAHDFNNLLTVMVGNLEMLNRRLKATGRNDSQSAEYLKTTSEAVDIGAKLVQHLLGFSRRQALNPRRVNLNNLVEGMMPLVRTSLGKSIEMQLSLNPAIPAAFADEVQLQNALLNLAVNARDAMPNGGTLQISTDEVFADEAFVSAHPNASAGHYLVLSVEDTGSGIAKADLAKVVEPFFTTKEVGKGSGLGLSMVYGFAKQSNGFLLIDSLIGVGTAVRVYMPVAAVAAADAPPVLNVARPKECVGGNGQTVLVVEDDDRVRTITTARLDVLGYRVIEAADAAAALRQIEKTPAIDLMLTDILMPGDMSGIELAREVGRRRPDIKIVFAAGFSKEADQLESEGRLGPWLRKPYKQAELGRKLREVLDAVPG